MTATLFSEHWASALGTALGASEPFQRAAREFEAPVVLDWSNAPAEDRTDGQCGVFLDLHRGACRASRMASANDYTTADYVLSADLDAWNAMLDGTLSPTSALMFGRMKLAKGSVMSLMPHVGMATELVRVAQQVQRTG